MVYVVRLGCMDRNTAVLIAAGITALTAILTQLINRYFQNQSEKRAVEREKTQKFFEYDLKKLEDIEKILEELHDMLLKDEVVSTTLARRALVRKCMLVSRDLPTKTALLASITEIFAATEDLLMKKTWPVDNGIPNKPDLRHESRRFSQAAAEFIAIYRHRVLGENMFFNEEVEPVKGLSVASLDRQWQQIRSTFPWNLEQSRGK